MEDAGKRINEFVNQLQREKMVKKYLFKNHWISGSSTVVYPITIWEQEIVVQWSSEKRIFGKFIDRIVKDNSDILNCGYFLKSDGSCPSEIVFKLKEI